MESDLTKEAACRVWLMAGEGEFQPEDWAGNINLYVDGANRVEAVPGLTEDLVHLKEMTMQEFFSSDQMECIVNEQTCRERDWDVGDEIWLNFFLFNGRQRYHDPKLLYESSGTGSGEDRGYHGGSDYIYRRGFSGCASSV